MREQFERAKRRIGNQKGFTLIELMAVLAILAIILAIAVPSIGKLIDLSKKSADESSIELMERAGELAHLDKLKFDSGVLDMNGEIADEAYRIPTLVEEGYLKLDKDEKFYAPGNYVVKKNNQNDNNPDNDDSDKPNKSGSFIYKGVGELDYEPTKPGDDEDEVVVGSCAINGVYAAKMGYDSKTVERDVEYSTMTMDSEGNYIAFGTFGFSDSLATPRTGYAVDKYNKDMKLIDTEILENAEGSDMSHSFDSVMSESGKFIVANGQAFKVFGSNLGYEQELTVDGLDVYGELRIEAVSDGGYVVAGLDNRTDQLVIAKLNKDFELVTREILPFYNSSDRRPYSWEVVGLTLLADGDILVTGSEYNSYDGSMVGRMLRMNEALAVESEFTLVAPLESLYVTGAAELADGTIVAYTGSDDDGSIMLRTFDANLEPLKEKAYAKTDDKYHFNRRDEGFVFTAGNTFTSVIQGNMVEFDADLVELSSLSANGLVMGDKYMIDALRDGDRYVSFGLDNKNVIRINQTRKFGDNLALATDIAPRVIHTAPPKVEDIIGLDIPVVDENQPPVGDVYTSGYSADTNRVNEAYAGSYILEMGQDGMPMGYRVGADGAINGVTIEELMPLLQSNGNTDELMFMFTDGKASLMHAATNASIPSNIAALKQGGADLRVDPCYEGSFMIFLGDMQMYMVDADGLLKSVAGDPYTASTDDFGYDIYTDALFYLYPDGEIVDFPDVRKGNIAT